MMNQLCVQVEAEPRIPEADVTRLVSEKSQLMEHQCIGLGEHLKRGLVHKACRRCSFRFTCVLRPNAWVYAFNASYNFCTLLSLKIMKIVRQKWV